MPTFAVWNIRIIKMIKFEEALEIVLRQMVFPVTENVELLQSVGRILAEDIVSDMEMPPFDKSAVDGYCCRRSDLSNILRVLEIIPAGQLPVSKISENECSKVMTGAVIPKGANCVIMIEHTQMVSPNQIRFVEENTANNICYAGEDVNKGETVLRKGQLIKPQHLAVMAMVGCTKPKVYQKAKVGIITTGDELVEPQFKPVAGKIRNSNAWQLIAQCNAMNTTPDYLGIAPDEKKQTHMMVRKAMNNNDVILLTGGVSMGDYDFVPEVLKEAGFIFHFKSVAMQPGRPTLFATSKSGKFCFGLPGNPVSSFNQFELLVKPLLYKMMGNDYQPAVLRLPLAKEYQRKKSDRINFLPVSLNLDGEISPVEYHGSAHINALTEAFGLMSVPAGISVIKKGERADVRPL